MEQCLYPVERNGYKWLGVLGNGSNSQVWKVLVLTGINKDKEMAIKRIDLEGLPDNKMKSIRDH